MLDLFERPLFVGAHVDDIELFAGATVARFASACRMVTFSQHQGCQMSPTQEAFDAARELGVTEDQLFIGTLPACQPTPNSFVDQREHIAEILRQAKGDWNPTIVITHQSTDTNQDHQLVHDEVKRVFRDTPIICGCFPFNDLPAADRRLFVRLDGKQAGQKVLALRAYTSQRALHRGYLLEPVLMDQMLYWGSLIGTQFAEAFEVIRIWI